MAALLTPPRVMSNVPSQVVPKPSPQVSPGSTYKFNEKTGIPEDVQKQIGETINSHQGRPLTFAPHVYDQSKNTINSPGMGQHGVHPDTVPNLNGKFPNPEHGWKPVEVEHNGKNLTKLVMRGPLNDTEDVSMPIVQGPRVKTLWRNNKNDTHRTLDLNKVHLPEEFKAGLPPKRTLMTSEETRRPGYRAVPHHNESARKHILEKYQHESGI
jgi:hypothetical protein